MLELQHNPSPMENQSSDVTARTDKLYEFDREPVDDANLKPGRYFAGLFAGEHVAGTEFVIGAFFVLHGVALGDLLLGLLVGNLLAVLSWTYICAPIAVRTKGRLRQSRGHRMVASPPRIFSTRRSGP